MTVTMSIPRSHVSGPTDVAGPYAEERRALADIGSLFYTRNWSLGTSSNYSIVVQRDPLRLLITASGRDKRALRPADFVIIDEAGRPIDPPNERPSAETLLHTTLARHAGAGSILHTHSVWGTVLSDRYFRAGQIEITGYEMIKGIAGHASHEDRLRVEIFDNTQDMAALSQKVADRLADVKRPLRHAFLLRGHGLYTWATDVAEARRHIEIFEFLFEVIGRSDPVHPA